MLKRIPIEELTPGMFVEGIAEQTGGSKLTQKGHVKSEETIAQLKSKGVTSVIIDTKKAKTVEASVEPVETVTIEKTKPRKSLEDRVGDARRLYDEAKNIQIQVVDSIKEGKPIDAAPIMEIADNLIDSIFNDQEAMLCATLIREKDDYLLEHSLNVSILLTVFARFLNLPIDEINQLAIGGFLHDIGKIKIDDAILQKPGRLTDEEFAEIKNHVNYGLESIEGMDGFSEISREVIALHHEKLDGNGYPNRLKGDEISRFGRMAAIADVYDAITAVRVYKGGSLASKAFRILMEDSGKHFDGPLVKQFIKCFGVYPVGTLVELKSGKLAMVVKDNPKDPLLPEVKVFYHLRNKFYIPTKTINLAGANIDDAIERSIRPESLDINLPAFFSELFF